MSKIRLHGSSSGYTEIAPVAASGNNTLTLPDDGTIISHDSAGAIGVTSVRATNAHFSGTTRVTTGITTTATITTAKVTTLADSSGANTSTPEQISEGRVKVWINFDMNAGSITDSFGFSSITDDGTGLFTLTYSSAFSNTNYCILSGQAAKIDADSDNRYISRVRSRYAGSMQVEHNYIENGTSNRFDSRFMYFAVLA